MRSPALVPAGRLTLAMCVLDLGSRELRAADSTPVDLRPKALDVLLVLAEHAGQVVDKSTLMARVWPGVVVGDDSLTQAVVEIRRALGDHEHKIVRTVARRGYRLQAEAAPATAVESPTAVPALSVAVLPISHDGDDLDGTRWAALLTSELSLRAGVGIPESKVAAQETVRALGPALSDPRHAARLLGVQLLMCGEFRACTDGWAVALSVVDGESGSRCWSHRFDIAQDQVPQGLASIAAQAARRLLVEMHRVAARAASTRPLGERSAGELALQGWASVYDGLSPGNLEHALQLFDLALEKEPTNLRALGGVTCIHYWRLIFCWTLDRASAQRCVIESASQLARLYPEATLAALARADAADVEGHFELRLSICDRLCAREGSNPSARASRGFVLLRLGRFDECVAELDAAQQASIDDFREGWWFASAAAAHLMAGRHAQAVHEARRAMAANACMPLPPLLLAAALAAGGQTAEGSDVLRQYLRHESRCNVTHVALLLGQGAPEYMQGCARVLAALVALGLPRGVSAAP